MKVFHSLPNSELDGTMMMRERFRNTEGTIIKAAVESFEIEEQNRHRFVLYTIRLYNALVDYRIKKRFSDFERLDLALRAKYPKEIFPKLPEKFYINNFDRAKIFARVTKLEKYLNELLIEFENKDPLAEIAEFIQFKKSDIISILGFNESSFQLSSKTDRAYLKLLFQTEDLQADLEELKNLIFTLPPSMKTARLIMKGDKNIKSIISFAFDTADCNQSVVEEHCNLTRKIRFSSFNENQGDQQANTILNKKVPLSKPMSTINDTTKGFFRNDQEEGRDESILAKKPKHEPYIHFTCSLVLSFLLEVLDFSKNPHAEIFRTAFKEVEIGMANHENFKRQLCAREFTVCKINCYQLLKIYKDICRSSKQFNECLLFSKNEEYRNFIQWYNRQSLSTRRDPIYSELEQQFPKINQLLLRESLHQDSLFQTMDFFMEKHLLNTLMVDEPKQLSKINFIIDEKNRFELIDCLLEFKWSPNILQVSRQSSRESNVFQLDSDHIFNMYLFSLNSDSGTERKVHLDWLKVYRVDKGERTIFLFAPQDLSAEDKEDIQLRYWNSEEKVFISTQERDLGFFVDIEPSRDNRGKLLVSILLKYSFMDKKNEHLVSNYKYLVQRMRLVKQFCERFT